MTDEKNKLTVGQIIKIMLYILLIPAAILFLAGDWFWIEGWIFSVWFLAMCLAVGAYLYWYDPVLLAERQKMPGSDNQKGWDKYYQSTAYIMLIAWLVIMPLDARRFGWSVYFPLWLKVLGGIVLLPAFFLLYRSVVDNTFASTMVRIQSERKQHVISTGVYGFVRHPMYLGNLLMLTGAPLLLGSTYGLIIGLTASLLMAGRIIGEEKMLVNELAGYEDYRRKVRYRLIPFLW